MSFLFFILAVLTLGGAIAAMTLRRLVHCALALTVALSGLAGLYLNLGAEFAGLAQLLVYVGAIAILVGVIPWTQIQPGKSITVSPFVRVFDLMHIPAAAHIINFVVLTAALSGMNCNLYLATRMIFSLSRGGYAPQVFGRVSKKGTPIPDRRAHV